MAWQGRRLCHPGPRRRLCPLPLRLLQQRCRPVALRRPPDADRPGLARSGVSERLFLVESSPDGLRAALVDDRRLQAIEIDRTAHPTRVGSVASAKVVRAVQGIGTFVKLDDGTELLLDRGGPAPKAGEEIAVQITRAARGDKAGGASRSVSLSGRGVIHLPGDSGIKLSKR